MSTSRPESTIIFRSAKGNLEFIPGAFPDQREGRQVIFENMQPPSFSFRLRQVGDQIVSHPPGITRDGRFKDGERDPSEAEIIAAKAAYEFMETGSINEGLVGILKDS